MTQMQEALVDGGVARADLQTSNASIQPTYGRQGRITGYAVNEGLTAKIRTTSDAGALITADAQAKAELYADQAGRTLGQVMSVTEEVPSNAFTTFASGAAEAMPVPFDVPLQPGREQLAVTVTVEWSFR
jgi:uncharacterized protein